MRNDSTTTIELASNSVLTVAPSMVFPNRCIDMRFYDRAAWASFGIELSADQARQLAAALVAQADAMQMHNAVEVAHA